MKTLTDIAIRAIERGLVPDSLVRAGIRRLLRERLDEIHADDPEAAAEVAAAFIDELRRSPIALVPERANEQHYEVPAEFYAPIMGRHRKYSSAYWPAGVTTLDDAEACALRLTCEHAGVVDGHDVLELGCGWGSLSLWLAANYPRSTITAASNSQSQRAYIEAQAEQRGLRNLHVITADMNRFAIDRRFDRIVSVEMFEHMRNWPELFARVHSWLKPGGRFFMHVFAHRSTPYAFVERDASDWMTRYFFAGGMMPSDDLPLHFQEHLQFVRRWRWPGWHYAQTLNTWLANMDRERGRVWPVLEKTYGRAEAPIWWMRWRIFFMASAELFAYRGGREWWVSHYLFERKS